MTRRRPAAGTTILIRTITSTESRWRAAGWQHRQRIGLALNQGERDTLRP
jgi:hypothetical protein